MALILGYISPSRAMRKHATSQSGNCAANSISVPPIWNNVGTIFPIANLTFGDWLPCPPVNAYRPTKIHNWVTTSPGTNNRTFTAVDST